MSLYWKIFASFGLAMTATLIGAVLVSFRLAELAFEQDSFADRGEIIREAASALDAGGEPALKDWLRRRPRSATTLLLVFDADGAELLGRRRPGRFIQSALEQSRDRPGNPRNFRPRRLMPRLLGPDGREYHLFFSRPPPALFGILDWPSAQLSVLAIAISAAAVAALLLARYLSAPIVQLQRASRALAAGDLSTRVGYPSNKRNDEVGTLARDFDTMAEQIQALMTAKETLLRDVSHELRSPLARIQVALALAERHSDPGARTHLQRIELETVRLDRLVGQILTLTRLRTNSDVRRSPVSLDAILTEIIENARFEHPDRKVDYQSTTPGVTLGDAQQIRSAVENVVRNALAHSVEGGEVTVRLSQTPVDYRITVADSGPGVPESELERIFEPFFRTDESRDHRRSGEGIGLAITSSVMEKHGGRATAINLAEGGLQITLQFPLGED